VIEPALGDNANAYQMDQDGVYRRRQPPDGAAVRSAQPEVLEKITRSGAHAGSGRRPKRAGAKPPASARASNGTNGTVRT